MSGVDGLFIILSGAAADEVEVLELASGAPVPVDVDDVDGAGVAVEDGGALGLIDEADDVEPVLGGVVVVDDEEDGAGVTTGGVVDVDGVLVSRWQPETPSAMPVQSNVMRAALLIVISSTR
jgi:hypothetical protein